jgi:hypothetical protein
MKQARHKKNVWLENAYQVLNVQHIRTTRVHTLRLSLKLNTQDASSCNYYAINDFSKAFLSLDWSTRSFESY